VRRALPQGPDLQVSVERVRVRPHQVELTGVRFEQPGVALTLPAALIELSLLDAVRENVAITRLVAKNWILDLSPAQRRATAAAGGAACAGIFGGLNLPVDLALDGAELEGEVRLLSQGQTQPSQARVRLSGGGLGSGREGTFHLVVEVRQPEADAPVSFLSA